MSALPLSPVLQDQIAEFDVASDVDQQVAENGVAKAEKGREYGVGARLDHSVTFEEFTYWAKIERELEEEEFRNYKALTSNVGFLDSIKGYFSSNVYKSAKANHDSGSDDRALDMSTGKTGPVVEAKSTSPSAPYTRDELDVEWREAARALRTAGWAGIFYLITTDILGWGQTPYVFSNTGYGLGAGIFVLMGLAAAASGFMIWRTFLGLDSTRFPVLSFGDPFFRLYNPTVGHLINVAQAIQMFLSVAVVLLGQTGIIAQLAGSVNLCYVVCGIIALVVSMASGYMRSLTHLSWFCNASVWLNIVSFIIM